jgi:alkanesulfonate monooxygenase SsuD/methylene tetrahydromethanopterin reductase-like flavin-dependent oxidoreductase (luciferase family)
VLGHEERPGEVHGQDPVPLLPLDLVHRPAAGHDARDLRLVGHVRHLEAPPPGPTSGGRVDLGTGRSSTRAELEGFGIDPSQTRGMWQEAIRHVVGCWTNDEHGFEGEHWSMPKRRVLPKPLQKPHPPIWGATSSEDGHRQVGELGLGLCSFAVGVPPESVKEKIDIYRSAIATCTEPIGAYVHDQASTFTMAVCAPTREEAWTTARESFEWYPRHGARLIATMADLMAERNQDLGNYAYAADLKAVADDGSLDLLTLEYLAESGACVLGTVDDCIETCKRYEAAGVDQLLCLVNPYKVPHEAVLQTIELMGNEVLPHFR